MATKLSEYEQQAQDFLDRFTLRFEAVRYNVQACPEWATADKAHKSSSDCPKCKTVHGDKYRVTFSRPANGSEFSTDFWRSWTESNRKFMNHPAPKKPTAYDVLAYVSGDANCEESFDNWCADYGYDTGSRSAAATHARCMKLAAEMRAFFTAEELEAMQEIQ